MKIVQFCAASSSFSLVDYEEDIFFAWYAQFAFQIKEYFPEIDVEGWTIERKYEKKKLVVKDDVPIRIFPTDIALRHSMEISWSMLRSLLWEQREARKSGRKLVVHLHEHHTWQNYLALFFLDKKISKIVSQHHGARSPLENLKRFKKLYLVLPLILIMQFLENWLFKKLDIVYCASGEDLKYMKKKAVNADVKFQTLGIGNEFFDWKVEKKFSRKKLGLDGKKKYGLFLGRITSKKGIKELIDAMEKISRNDIEILLIGGGPEVEDFKKYASSNNLNNVHFLGSIYDQRKMHYLAACDFLILPSYTESVPIVIMEAIAMKLPVVASKVGGIPKIIENGREGVLIEPRSSDEIIRGIEEVLKFRDKDIRSHAERFRWETIIKNLVEVYGGL